MKKSILIIVIWPISFFCAAQSYLGLSIGIDYSQIREVENAESSIYEFWVNNKGFETKSIFYTIFGEKHFSKKLSACLAVSYTKKDFSASNSFFIPIIGAKFSSFLGILSVKWHLNENFYLGSGGSINYVKNMKTYLEIGTEYPVVLENSKKYGAIFIVGYNFRNIFIEPYWLKGIKTGGKSRNVDLRPINSFGISLGYRLKMPKKRKMVISF